MQKGIFKSCFILLILGIGLTAQATPKKTLIFYPSTSSQNIVYQDLIDAIKKSGSEEIFSIAVNPTPITLTPYIQQYQPTRIIALDLSVAMALKQSAYKLTSFAAGMYFSKNELNGVGLSIDSRVLDRAFQTLAPLVKRVFVVTPGYAVVDVNPGTKLLYTIKPGHSDDLAINTKLLVQLIEQEALPTDLIIVPPNIPDDIFFEIGKIAWEKSIMLATMRPSHLANGAFMAIQPNYLELAKQINAFEVKLGYQSVQHIILTWNKKVAEHLGVATHDALMPINIDLK